jgi:DNA-binding response OmpR family regulator
MTKTILCIDDTALILQLYRRIFEENGYKVLLASNGWDGLDALKRQPVDCVILDYQMPEMDGAGVVRRMRRHATFPPVILVCGSDPPWELLAQVDAFVPKPFLAEELLESVEGVIAAREEKEQQRASPTRSTQEINAYPAD